MYLSNLKLWNFRRFGANAAFDLAHPNLEVDFNKGINLIIGENDSGKSGIIDAIKLILKTHSSEWIRIDHEDFFNNSQRLRIECVFEDLTNEEAQNFTEWLGADKDGNPYLRLILDVSRNDKRILPADTKAGVDDEGAMLTAVAKDKLKTTYLRPLRDAANELSSKRNSRLSQILASHIAFQDTSNHRFIGLTKTLNDEVTAYFKGQKADGSALPAAENQGKTLKEDIDNYLGQFSGGKRSALKTTEANLKNILESLSLLFENGYNLGLGSHNLLCIASELLHLQKSDWNGLRLGLVEEIEAHLHPQAQMQVIETLQTEAEKHGIQLIFTTHSPNIGSKIKLENLIVCQNGVTYPMGLAFTALEETDYTFLQRFLDVTKANLFFAKGVILVEGWAEELIIPTIAKKIGIPLTANGISVVNIGNTAFLRYSKVFQRKGDAPISMSTNVAIITDVDIKPLLANITRTVENADGSKTEVLYTQDEINVRIAAEINRKALKYNGQVVSTFVSPYWTLEYCLAKSPKLRKIFYKSVLEALLEQKKDEGVGRLENYENAIVNIETHFNNWADNEDSIAFAVMQHILTGQNALGLAKDEISKSIIAQRFSDNLEKAGVIDLTTEASIAYILNAIRHAANR